jgi:hypothetical protein
MEIQCPVCKSALQHELILDGQKIHEIDNKGNVKLIHDRDNTFGRIYCSFDGWHKIPAEIFNEVMLCIGKEVK